MSSVCMSQFVYLTPLYTRFSECKQQLFKNWIKYQIWDKPYIYCLYTTFCFSFAHRMAESNLLRHACWIYYEPLTSVTTDSLTCWMSHLHSHRSDDWLYYSMEYNDCHCDDGCWKNRWKSVHTEETWKQYLRLSASRFRWVVPATTKPLQSVNSTSTKPLFRQFLFLGKFCAPQSTDVRENMCTFNYRIFKSIEL